MHALPAVLPHGAAAARVVTDAVSVQSTAPVGAAAAVSEGRGGEGRGASAVSEKIVMRVDKRGEGG